jgi:tRNA (guanine37-N1)-methyltransferase
MKFDIVTIFPAMLAPVLSAGVVGRAIARGALQVRVRDLRDFTSDRHRSVDDVPFGGGPGMVLKAEPIFRALDEIGPGRAADDGRAVAPFVVLTSPQGTPFMQRTAQRLSVLPHVVLLCGRYEGVDDRVRSRVDEEISIGDFVLSGGELPALMIVDAIARLVPGVVGDEQSVAEDSFTRGLLDFPQYTRPAELASRASDGAGALLRVPDVLLSGNHAEIRRWRKREAVSRTLVRRPDLLEAADLDQEEQEILRELIAQQQKEQET